MSVANASGNAVALAGTNASATAGAGAGASDSAERPVVREVIEVSFNAEAFRFSLSGEFVFSLGDRMELDPTDASSTSKGKIAKGVPDDLVLNIVKSRIAAHVPQP